LSPRLLKKLVYAGSNATSCKQARDFLAELAGYDCKPWQVLRACHRIGAERLEQRAAVVASFEDLTLAQRDMPPCAPPELIAIMADGGRLQIRPNEEEQELAAAALEAKDGPATSAAAKVEAAAVAVAEREAKRNETAPAALSAEAVPAETAPKSTETEAETSEKGRFWKEDKIGIFLHLAPTAHETDPCPELPEVFRDPLVVLKLAREVGHADLPAGAGKFQRAKAEEGRPDVADVPEEPEASEPSSANADEKDKKNKRRPGAPKVSSRRVVATRQSVETFGPMLAAMAWSMGFLAAKRGAFVGDGAAWLWCLQKSYFPRLTPVVDFIHVLSYVFAAALAGRADLEEGWPVYQEWITWVWKGEVERLLAALRQRLEELPEGSEARETVANALGFLEGQKGHMDYATYRQQGLPIMSSLVESTVKQIGRRVKGTEKFWTEEGAEALLQLRADYLSDDEPMAHFWTARSQRMTGQNPYRRKAG